MWTIYLSIITSNPLLFYQLLFFHQPASTTLQSAPHPSTSLQPINDPAHAPTSWQLPPQLESYTSAHLSPFPHDDFQNDLPPRSYASLQPSQQLQECVGFPALHSIPFRDYLQKVCLDKGVSTHCIRNFKRQHLVIWIHSVTDTTDSARQLLKGKCKTAML